MSADEDTRDLSSIHGCIFLIHGDGTLLDLNQEAARRFRISRKNNLGKPFYELQIAKNTELAESLKVEVQAWFDGNEVKPLVQDAEGQAHNLNFQNMDGGVEVHLRQDQMNETLTDTPSASTIHDSVEKVGKYRLETQIGRGGMGKVYLAKDAFDNQVAIKLLISGELAENKELLRFRREGVIMARLNHRNICRIIEMGEHLGRRYIAMEHIEGKELGALINKFGLDMDKVSQPSNLNEPLTSIRDSNPHQQKIKRILRLFLDILEGVNYAHQFGIIHRDLKPANIMIRESGEPVVMDFGLAKYHNNPEDLEVSQSGEVMGTLEYIAPEQATGSRELDGRADIYSACAMLYFMLTGHKKLHSSGNIYEDIKVLRERTPHRPSVFNSYISADLDVVIMKGLAIEAEQRYQNIRSLATDLQAIINDMPITARKEKISERFWRTIRKHKAITVSILVTFFLFTGLLSYHYFSMRASLERYTKAELATKLQRERAGKAIAQLQEEMHSDLERGRWKEAKIKALEILALHRQDQEADEILQRCDFEIMKMAHPIPDQPPSGHPSRIKTLELRLSAWQKQAHQPWAREPIESLTLAIHEEDRAKELFLKRYPWLDLKVDGFGPYFINALGMRMRWVPPGQFTMGDLLDPQVPLKKVVLTRGCFMSETEITQAQWNQVLDANPSMVKGDRHPVDTVAWHAAMNFAEHLNRREGLPFLKSENPEPTDIKKVFSRAGYRLPTEAEWEYACRADLAGQRFHWEALGLPTPQKAPLWYRDNSGERLDTRLAREVSLHPPNPWGFYDMHGNLFEWTLDTFNGGNPSDQTEDPVYLNMSKDGILRGGSVRNPLISCRAGIRLPFPLNKGNVAIGFRVVYLPEGKMATAGPTGLKAE